MNGSDGSVLSALSSFFSGPLVVLVVVCMLVGVSMWLWCWPTQGCGKPKADDLTDLLYAEEGKGGTDKCGAEGRFFWSCRKPSSHGAKGSWWEKMATDSDPDSDPGQDTPTGYLQGSVSMKHLQSSVSMKLQQFARPTATREAFEDKYILKELLATGTSAQCYRCVLRASPKQEFAVKIINKNKLALDIHAQDIILKQLRTEIEILQKLSHPNIVSMHSFMESSTHIYIVMEYMRGGDLFEYVVENGCLREEEVIHICQSIADGLACLHQHGIIHRDIKPDNVIMAGGPMDTIKLVDFGLSSVRPLGAFAVSFMGTAGYVAPEILQAKSYNGKVDVWSLGVIAYALLSGQMPFDAKMTLLPRDKIPVRSFPLLFPDSKFGHISTATKDLIWSMLQVDPLLRISATGILDHPAVGGSGLSRSGPMPVSSNGFQRFRRNMTVPDKLDVVADDDSPVSESNSSCLNSWKDDEQIGRSSSHGPGSLVDDDAVVERMGVPPSLQRGYHTPDLGTSPTD